MPEIVHPRLPRDRRTVPADALPEWLAAGWLPVEKDDPEPDPAPEPERRHPDRTPGKD